MRDAPRRGWRGSFLDFALFEVSGAPSMARRLRFKCQGALSYAGKNGARRGEEWANGVWSWSQNGLGPLRYLRHSLKRHERASQPGLAARAHDGAATPTVLIL